MKLSSGDARWIFLASTLGMVYPSTHPRISCIGKRIVKQPIFNTFRELLTVQERSNLAACFSLEYREFGYGSALTKTTHCVSVNKIRAETPWCELTKFSFT
jgi:hypothetical protein